jgi:hypothetical protein
MILKGVYRNTQKVLLHGEVFRAVAVITQLEIDSGEQALFQVQYNDLSL